MKENDLAKQLIIEEIREKERVKNNALLNKLSIDYKRELQERDRRVEVEMPPLDSCGFEDDDLDRFRHL